MKYLACAIVVLLLLAHQDYRQFDRTELLFDFLPFSLGYHMLISLATALAWLLVVRTCWPEDLDENSFADKKNRGAKSEGSQS